MLGFALAVMYLGVLEALWMVMWSQGKACFSFSFTVTCIQEKLVPRVSALHSKC